MKGIVIKCFLACVAKTSRVGTEILKGDGKRLSHEWLPEFEAQLFFLSKWLSLFALNLLISVYNKGLI